MKSKAPLALMEQLMMVLVTSLLVGAILLAVMLPLMTIMTAIG